MRIPVREASFIFWRVLIHASSSILWIVLRFALATWLVGSVCLGVSAPARADEVQAGSAKSDAFFAGTIVEAAPDRITVARTVLGKTENRTFLTTAETKVEGKIAANARVTVRYISEEGGDRATMIVVRTQTPTPRPSDKKK
jgi:hypothetical protein